MSKNYFTQETEDAIVAYNTSTDFEERSKIYETKIHYAFFKLTQNIIHTFKFYYTEVDNIEDLKYEVISFLLQKLHLYDQSKGKAYSYFGTIAKRYLIIYNQKNYKKMVSKMQVSEVDNSEKTHESLVIGTETEDINRNSVINQFIDVVDNNLSLMFEKESEMKVADAILEVFKKRENIDIFNKKALFIYIKEITDCQSNTITKVIKKLKVAYKEVLDHHIENVDQ
jgi:hypothetical protein